ncbi:MAG: UrcA family protein [Pseudomonadota bacterium]|nr:UrcA family protein [Pseudomonadota bacterium]
MRQETSINPRAVLQAKITLLMVLCGVFGAATTSPVRAASVADDVPQRVVRYSPLSLNTETGVRSLYHHIVRAAEQICPAPSSTRLVSTAVAQCRAQAIARAVHQIDSPRLAALYSADSKRG